MMDIIFRDIHISPPWVDYIFQGVKKVEMRKNNPDNWGALHGKRAIFNVHSEELMMKYEVVDSRTYKTLNEALICEGVRNLLPGKTTLEEARDIYLGFDGNSDEAKETREKEFNEYGCIVFELKPAGNKYHTSMEVIEDSITKLEKAIEIDTDEIKRLNSRVDKMGKERYDKRKKLWELRVKENPKIVPCDVCSIEEALFTCEGMCKRILCSKCVDEEEDSYGLNHYTCGYHECYRQV